MRIEWATRTDTGRVRAQNEDTVRAEPASGLVVLCDGMGGHRAGEVASRLASETFLRTAAADAADPTAPDGSPLPPEIARLVNAARRANEVVYENAESRDAYRGMGCTLVALRLHDDTATFVSLGDSRLYLLREGILRQISQDHTRLRLLEQMGYRLEPTEAKQLQGMLVRALGTKPMVEVDHGSGPALSGDLWMLCSDGLTDELADEEILSILESAPDAESAAEECVRRALEAGGRDNVSVAVALIVSGREGAGTEEIPRPAVYSPEPGNPEGAADSRGGFLSRLSHRLRGETNETDPPASP
jgi:protein phosphatase